MLLGLFVMGFELSIGELAVFRLMSDTTLAVLSVF